MTALLLEMPIFWVRAACEYDWQVMAPNMHHSLFPMHHLGIITCTCITENYRSYMDVLHIE